MIYPALIIDPAWRARMVACERDGYPAIYTDSDRWCESLERITGCKMDRPVCIGDVAQRKAATAMLKFVEDAVTPVICFASTDCFDPVFLSRFMEIDKTPQVIPNEKNVPAGVMAAMQKDGDDTKRDIRPMFAREAPSAMPLVFYLRRSSAPAKMKLMGF